MSINQPAYMPWLGYFDRIAKSDLHIVLDHVQFEKNSVVNRNKIRNKTGWSWLSVPVRTKGRFGDLKISDLEVDDSSSWAKKHLATLQSSYSRASYFCNYAEYFCDLYKRDWPLLAPLLWESTSYLLRELGIFTELVRSSELSPKLRKSELILELCKEAGATTYLSGPLGRDYLDLKKFDASGIKVQFHDYQHPKYKQAFQGFEPYMSVVDLLFNHGAESLKILRT